MDTDLLFLGTDSVTPAAGDDTASFVIDGHIQVDCGWCAAMRLRDHGLTPLDIDTLLLTHGHHDHYLGLPQLLFYRWQRDRDGRRGPLTIVGPREDLATVVQLAVDFLQAERFGWRPRLELRGLAPGEGHTGDGWRVVAARTIHPVPGLCYRWTGANGVALAFTGDTAYCEALVEHVRGVDLLVHEASCGARAMRGEATPWGHCGAPDAAEIARLAEVGRLALVHAPPEARDEAVAAARAIFPNSFWPTVGQRLRLTPRSAAG